jgi:hypothetical protein
MHALAQFMQYMFFVKGSFMLFLLSFTQTPKTKEKKVNLQTKTEIIAWFFTQLNKLEQLAYLRKKGAIPGDAMEFFGVFIEFGCLTHVPQAVPPLLLLSYKEIRKLFPAC